jgi:hypothetical protein
MTGLGRTGRGLTVAWKSELVKWRRPPLLGGVFRSTRPVSVACAGRLAGRLSSDGSARSASLFTRGRAHSEPKRRLVDAERRRAEIELELSGGTWHDPRRGEVRFSVWAGEWLLTRDELRPTTHARLATTLSRQVLPRFGATPLLKISNGAVRAWVAEMVASGLSPATVRKAVFALRQCLAAAISDDGWR